MNRSRSTLALFFMLPLFSPAAAPDWFPRSDMMSIGVYYYPEAWPESQWARDMANMRKMGMEFVHLGEFAWSFMEPEEGHFELDWLEKNVALAAQNHLKVILCTPSATPPIWLTRKYPEILMVDAAGRRMNHGGRQQADWSAPVYRDYVAKIDAELAKRFGRDPRVWGWQIDNELSHYEKEFSYSPAATARFRAWLREKYGTIARLNADWGTAFWSMVYQNFDQIEIPNQLDHPGLPNPHAQLDFNRWFAAEAADYLRFQAATLRQNGVAAQWITTNYMAMYPNVDPTLSAKDLDAFTWTHYPVHGDVFPENGPLGFRLGSGAVQSFMHDFMRPINGLSGLMELQPGQVNWGAINPWPQPGAIHMWIMRAFAAGARIVCTYRYRQPLFGNEQYHKGLVETDGVTPSPGGREYSRAMADILKLRPSYRPDAKEPAAYAKRRTAFLINFDNRWDIENHKQTTRWDTHAHWLKYYRALKSMMAPVDVVTEDRDLAAYPFVVAPAYQLVDQALIAKWTAYAGNGGHLILTARTGQKDRRGHFPETLWAEQIYRLIGARLPIYDLLPGNLEGTVTAEGVRYSWGSWADILEPEPGTTSLATYSDQFYAGRSAAVTHKLGKGSVTYIGVDTEKGDLEMALLRKIYAATAPATLKPDFLVDWRDGFWVATNFTSLPQVIPAAATAHLLLGARTVAPGGVTVWQE
uniref:Beta-galactosidase n=1 Tax=Solibacter usitatus (strain Ellin6076) TaxID=234267 RepID=Q01YA8_SOLUE